MTDTLRSERAAEELAAEHGVGDPFAAAIRATRMAMVVTDASQADNPIIFANDAFLALTGYRRDEVIGRNCRFLQGPDTDPASIEAMRRAVADGQDMAIDILNYRKDGTTFWNALYLSPVRSKAGEIVYFFGSQLNISDRKRAELELGDTRERLEAAVEARTADLTQALQQKTALLHEVDHRVKNNLQLISSLLLLQNRRVTDPAVKSHLRGMLERVSAIATVHRRLFQSEDVERFDVAAFVRDLVSDMMGGARRDDIKVRLDLERVDIAASKAAPLALVISELFSNALRHAFPPEAMAGRTGEVFVGITRQDADFRIEITDNGVGVENSASSGGFGLTIVQLLCQQLKARPQTTPADPGTRVVVYLPVNGVHH
ncbi:histidine kinase [Caulobacter sp. Root1455]|uniref:photosensory histidine protein kinase LovK n=1 Tax=unclassified Caulobacter TaxID=2648921 RepID=UPI0006FE66B1|nr:MULTISPECIES: histidine kinase dimerization/phosphoacceptor domain -containing protein [unclassified Caulobacter]KQY35603.1 histidine kinase [Caulobacter sp. Root487D2Y]KQZ06431.1 histidine kinase [Caulobacter sp. Root1455]